MGRRDPPHQSSRQRGHPNRRGHRTRQRRRGYRAGAHRAPVLQLARASSRDALDGPRRNRRSQNRGV